MQELQLNNNMLFITPRVFQKQVIGHIQKKGLWNIKIMTLEELRKNYEFDYGKEAIFYIMQKYHYQYDVAKMYLTHLYEVGENDFGSEKIRKIIDLKKELLQEGLLEVHDYFKNYLKGKELIFYNYDHLKKQDQTFINSLKEWATVSFYHEKKQNFHHDIIWEFDTIEEEVSFVASSICHLLHQNISINQIKLCGVDEEYNSIIKRIFEWYHIPISFYDHSLYATRIGQDFLNNLKETAEESLKYIEENYSLKNPRVLEFYNQMITILNQYAWCTSIEKLRDFLIEDFKNEKLDTTQYENEVKIVNCLTETTDNDYVFLLGFNQGCIPKTYKDEDYFNDHLKSLLGLDTTDELNSKNYQKWLEEINQTKNLIITTKKNSSLGTYYLSSLNDDLQLEVKKGTIGYLDSNLYNKIQLTEKLDILVKYNENSSGLSLLLKHYPNINYAAFNADYHSIDKSKLKDYLHHQLTLSYSAMNTYYQCAFRYYLSNILKLNIYKETFYTILGNLFHYILSICFTKNIDIKEEYRKYLSKCTYPFNSREKFFLKHLEKELEFIIITIQKHMETSDLKNLLLEEKIEVDKSREDMQIIFKGFVDKMMLNEDKSIISIIDYKTGNPDLNLNHIIYGLDLQLPVYIYLAKKKFPNARIAGFYLQKILNNEISKDYKHTYQALKEEKLKLQGYSNSDIEVLQEFDSSYYESKVIKGMRTTSKGIATKKILSDEQMDTLEEITEQKIEEAITNILNANFSINPKRIGMDNLGCKYCEYKDICFMTEKNIENLKEYKNMEFLQGGDNDDTEETS